MSSKLSIKILLGMLASVVGFHICILLKIVPYDIAWGGRLKNDTEMYVFEFISIGIILLLCLTLLIRGKYIKQFVSDKTTSIVLWIFMVLFALNTVGNIFAITLFEKFFAILTLFICVLLWFILKPRKSKA